MNTSSGHAMVTPADSWVEVATPAEGTDMAGGPQATVLGTMTFAGNWLDDPFNNPLSYSGHEGNFQAYVNTLTLPPAKSKSLLHFVVLGQRVTTATSANVRAAVEATATRLVAVPEIRDLTMAEICPIANFNLTSLCTDKKLDVVRQPPPPKARAAVTSSSLFQFACCRAALLQSNLRSFRQR